MRKTTPPPPKKKKKKKKKKTFIHMNPLSRNPGSAPESNRCHSVKILRNFGGNTRHQGFRQILNLNTVKAFAQAVGTMRLFLQ